LWSQADGPPRTHVAETDERPRNVPRRGIASLS
jgi:hypothetical protein